MSTAAGTARALRERPRIGFLGLGWIGLHRMEAICESSVAEIAAIADTEPLVIERARQKATRALALTTLDELLDQDLDGVVIATPSALHAEQAIAALQRGVAVFCQKPLGRNADEVTRVVEAACAADRLLGVDLSYRCTAGMRKIHELVRSEALRDVYAVNLVFHNAYGPDKPWFYDARLSGGGALMDLGIHMVDLALWVLDYPKVTDVQSRLYAHGKPLLPGQGAGSSESAREVEDYVLAELTLETGASVRLACSWKLHAGRDCILEASFYAPHGGATFYNVGGSFYDFRAEQLSGTSVTPLSEPPDAWGGRAAIQWADRLSQGAGFDRRSLELIEVAKVLDRIYDPTQAGAR